MNYVLMVTESIDYLLPQKSAAIETIQKWLIDGNVASEAVDVMSGYILENRSVLEW